MGTKMKKAPVFFTVAEVRFNPVLSLDKYIAPIQERLRLAGFPDFQRQIASRLSVQAPDETSSSIHLSTNATYVFSDIDSVNAVLLRTQSVSLQTAEYDVFDKFLEGLIRVLEMLHDVVKLSYIERVGIRYLDAVIPSEGQELKDFLQPEMLGLVGKLEGTLSHSFSETMTLTDAGSMISRVVIQDGKVGFPPDMQSRGVKLPLRFAVECRHAVIDTDGFYEGRHPFDLPSIKARLVALHDQINKSFRATVTPNALKVWS